MSAQSFLCLAFCVALADSAMIAQAADLAPVHSMDSIHFVIPGGAGGGWDRTARGVGEALVAAGLLRQATYENLSGGGGARGIAHTIELGDPRRLLVNSTPIVIRALQRVFPQSFRDLTPIASVIGDYSVIAVREHSTHQSLHALLAAQRVAPRQVAFAGGSVPGGTDHIVAAMLVRAGGGDPRSTKYIPYDAGGKALAGLLSGEVAALSSGYSEVVDLARQGWIRILCIAALQRLPEAPDVPTCSEAGAPGAVFVNWRGFFAAPSLSSQQATAYRELLAELRHSVAWQQVRQRHGWVDLYRPGADFERLLNEQEATLRTLMHELELL